MLAIKPYSIYSICPTKYDLKILRDKEIKEIEYKVTLNTTMEPELASLKT